MTAETTDAASDTQGETAQGATALLDAILTKVSAEAAEQADIGQRNDGAGPGAPSAVDEKDGETPLSVSLGRIFDRMEERGFGLMLLILALPCCLPFVYLLPQLVAGPMLLLAGQMAAGRHAPWLPEKVRARSFPISSLRDVVNRSRRYVGWFEKLSRPRLLSLSSHKASRVIGLLMMPPCASILVPLPLTNTLPGIGVAIAAVGLIERDGLLILLGLTIGLGWVLLLLLGGPAFLAWLAASVSSMM
ncbi:MAG: exopolysaccharide biosynthesis protein [Pseudomonadota bacterium]